LLSQFLSPNVNRRSDAWGGSLENRARILLRVIDRVRERVSPKFALGVKLNAGDFVKGGLMPEEVAQVMRWLDQRALDFIEISGGTFERPASFGDGLRQSTKAREGYFLELAAAARSATSIPLIVTGGFRSKRAMQDALVSGACDLVGLARPLAVEPDLPRRMFEGTAARATEVKLALPRGPIGPLAELYWYREQLGRLALGGSSRQGGSGLSSLVTQMLRDVGRLLCQLWQRRVCH
jgi:2,4-dienoyl-CoA reductase-like NADH-dependent reductase (Old Yellow Enzyme family)